MNLKNTQKATELLNKRLQLIGFIDQLRQIAPIDQTALVNRTHEAKETMVPLPELVQMGAVIGMIEIARTAIAEIDIELKTL